MNSNKVELKKISGKRLLYFVTSLVCILMTAAVAIILMNRIVVGGTNYNSIKKNTDAIENIALINSGLYQLLNEVRPIMQDSDKGSAITMARLLALDIDKRFVTLQDLVRSSGRKEIINKVNLVWKEYKKTLMEEIIPASAKGDRLKIAYLTTGIQSQRFNSISKNMTALTANLRQDITQAELQSASDKNIILALIAFLTAILLCITACLQRISSSFSGKQPQTGIQPENEVCIEKPADKVKTANQPELEFNMHVSEHPVSLTQCPVPDEIVKTGCELMDASVFTNSLLSEQKTAINDLSAQAVQLIQTSGHLASDLTKLDSWSSNNQSAAANMTSTNQETALKTDQLDKAAEQLHHDTTNSATAIKTLHTHICSLKNTACDTASSSVYLDAGIKLLHSNSLESVTAIQIVRQKTESGRQLIDDSINSISELRTESQITTEAVEKLSLKARTINSLNSTIAEMAEQTKLLAFNATIIAAQAGEHGNDFAVVADEITYLSERTTNTTNKISDIISSMQKETHLTVDSICNSEAYIIKSEQLSQRLATTLDDIIKEIHQASTRIQQIADAASIRAGESRSIREELLDLAEQLEEAAESAGEQSELSGKLPFSTESIKQSTATIRSEAHDQLSRSCIITNAAVELCNLKNEIQETGLNLYTQGEAVSTKVSNISETCSKAAAVTATTRDSAEELAKQIDLMKESLSFSKN